ncbi:branched-chain amino acid ABC transporter permease [Denitromonas ohlonensis]|uniref:Branched-chain amino acid ABC transporter permease n=2 Tax=Denitromonas TaxID=139331 RepID=A0A557SBB1_9RHOO|nr:branched-chain amino acid ABC transporter permease [Denitromonas ohlonensis]TVT51099.1 MAG: branched-chain amino acid ABC transporter permease [Denitromonas halophila]TVO68424.1 branched-chain amino acid ABC transporter permease [Denitromonas ohlonensis]TVO74702.1 branched-chain amino acid ABC transporter permease [Denitromonas ohlonensis]TVT71248.1 MAG: branched-chain amino acid ABC transporter permease [Denitromonas halophila]TVT72274.1 MAG: branched-chain amino acid ABC transporter perme
MILQILLSGIATGCIYGLVALSFVLVYKATEAVSFMQGELLMVGAFAAVALTAAAGWPAWLAVAVAVAGMALAGALVERLALRRAMGQPHLTAVLLTFGLGLMLRGGVTTVPAATHSAHQLALPGLSGQVQLGSLTVSFAHLGVIAATVLTCAALAAFFRLSRAGLALRACSENPRIAAMMGVSTSGMHTLAWALGAALAALAGILMAPVTFVHPAMGVVALKAFPAAVIGGMHSLPGALAGGVFIGVAEALAGRYLPEGANHVTAYVLMLLALLCFPRGLFAGRSA